MGNKFFEQHKMCLDIAELFADYVFKEEEMYRECRLAEQKIISNTVKLLNERCAPDEIADVMDSIKFDLDIKFMEIESEMSDEIDPFPPGLTRSFELAEKVQKIISNVK